MSLLKLLNQVFRNNIRLCSTQSPNDNISSVFVNRNPRNLEKMRIALKPEGYHLEKPGRSFWNKLELKKSGRHITANIIHHIDGTVVSASTKEWAIRKQLYKTTDTSAYINLARVLAQRCTEFGVFEVRCDIKSVPGGKIESFLKTVSDNGLKLTESSHFKPHRPWDKDRPPKPWEYEY